MKRVHKLSVLIPCFLMFAVQPVPGQEPERRPVPQPAGQRAPDAGEAHLVTVEFPGGTMREFIAALEQSTSEPVNIVGTGPTDRMTVDPMTLRNVDVNTALRVATARVPGTEPYAANLQRYGTAAETPVYHVQVVEMRPPRPMRTREAHQIEVFSLREVLGADIPADTILTAVEVAISLDPEAPEPAMRFHEPSSLLIIHGTASQVRAARQVVDELSAAASTAHRERKLERTSHQLEVLRKRRERIGEELERASARQREVQQRVFQLMSRRGEDRPTADERERIEDAQREATAVLNQLRADANELDNQINHFLRLQQQLQPAEPHLAQRVQELEAQRLRLQREVERLRAELESR